jgi:hypothetical protein
MKWKPRYVKLYYSCIPVDEWSWVFTCMLKVFVLYYYFRNIGHEILATYIKNFFLSHMYKTNKQSCHIANKCRWQHHFYLHISHSTIIISNLFLCSLLYYILQVDLHPLRQWVLVAMVSWGCIMHLTLSLNAYGYEVLLLYKSLLCISS